LSYDLFILPHAFDANAIRAHFEARPWYRVEAHQAFYSNEETGVYFAFDILENPESEEDSEPRQPHVAFNLNFFRPHTFALEAEPEIAAFLARFPGRTHDPQLMGDEPYSRDGFLKGWNHGNRAAFSAMAGQGANAPLLADPAHIESAWRWNYNRRALQEKLGDNVFVPRVVWLQPSAGAAPVRCATWTFGIPSVIPEALITHVVLVRQKRPTLMKMFSRQQEDPGTELKLLGVESGIRLRGVERGEVDGMPVLFTPVTGPLEVQALFSGAWPKPAFTVVPTETVLGSDLAAPAT
jgi:hypothetical protein